MIILDGAGRVLSAGEIAVDGSGLWVGFRSG